MKIILKIFLVSLFFGTTTIVVAQKKYPTDYFNPPLNIPLQLAGTFGELRSNHFHSGIDIRTQGKEGFNVYAPADGYVSRIKVSAWGFGNALYITHPNGYVTVYGHLKAFNSTITNYLRRIQYEKESFNQNLFLPKNKIAVKKGDIIAITGNTGSSGGPHLHYEIRDQKTAKPINPLFFGLKAKDNLQPIIKSAKIFTENGLQDKVLSVKKNGRRYVLKTKDTISVPAKFSLGIATYDILNNANSKNGIYQLKLFVDTLLFYKHTLKTFSFGETRYINCLVNYPSYIKTGVKYLQTNLLQGSKLSIYDHVTNKGWIELSDNGVHMLKYKALDINGNCSELTFYVKKDASMQNIQPPSLPSMGSKLLVRYTKPYSFNTKEVKVYFPAYALYEDILMKYNSSPAPAKYYSKYHEIHDIYTPLHKKISLSLKTKPIADSLKSKLLIVRIKKNNRIVAKGGKYENGFIKVNINKFGKFAVRIDTILPTIKPLNFKNKTNVSKLKTLKIKIKDNLSGIKRYRATLNKKWILMEFDGKKGLLKYTIDERMLKGSNLLKVVVEDNRQNISELNVKLIK